MNLGGGWWGWLWGMGLGGGCWGCMLEGVGGRCLSWEHGVGAGWGQEAAGPWGRWGQEFVTVGDSDRVDKSSHDLGQHKGLLSPAPTYAAPQWLLPNTSHGLG